MSRNSSAENFLIGSRMPGQKASFSTSSKSSPMQPEFPQFNELLLAACERHHFTFNYESYMQRSRTNEIKWPSFSTCLTKKCTVEQLTFFCTLVCIAKDFGLARKLRRNRGLQISKPPSGSIEFHVDSKVWMNMQQVVLREKKLKKFPVQKLLHKMDGKESPRDENLFLPFLYLAFYYNF